MDCNMDKDDKLSFVNAVIQRSRIAVLNYSKTKLLVIFNGVKLDNNNNNNNNHFLSANSTEVFKCALQMVLIKQYI